MTEALLYVALDHNSKRQNIDLAESLYFEQGNFGFKINQDHYTLWPDYVKTLEQHHIGDKPLFIDTKISNGSRTMSNIVQDIVSLGARHTNVWANAERLIRPLLDIVDGTGTELLGVTVTTHFTEKYCQAYFRRSLRDTVRMWSEVALENGCNGIIVPGTALRAVEDLRCTKVVPAVRPLWFKNKGANDQEQTVTPTEAIQGGANIVVCGTPIYTHPKPTEALQMILEEITNAQK